MKQYYCDSCKDKLCEKCIDLPWECPEMLAEGGVMCYSCKEEAKTMIKLYVKFLQEVLDKVTK